VNRHKEIPSHATIQINLTLVIFSNSTSNRKRLLIHIKTKSQKTYLENHRSSRRTQNFDQAQSLSHNTFKITFQTKRTQQHSSKMSEISKAEIKSVHDLFFPPEDSSPLIVKLKISPERLRQLTAKLAAKLKPVGLHLRTAHKVTNDSKSQLDHQQPVSAAALVKVFETGITTFLENREEKIEELRVQLCVQKAEIERLRSEAKDLDKVRREFDVQKSQLEVEKSMRERGENQKTQLEKEKQVRSLSWCLENEHGKTSKREWNRNMV
jgi:hypothetical protein